MILDNVNIGLTPDDGTGDKLRNAFNTVNENFDELELKTQEIDEELLKKDLVNTGYIDGLHLSINTDNTKFNISAGNYVINLDGDVSLLVFDELLALTPVYLTTANATYIGLNVNKQVIQQSSPFTNEQRRSICPIGAVIHSNRTIINTVNQIKAPLKYTLNQLHDVIKVLGSLNLEGNTYSPNGSNLQIDKSAGTVFALGINSENSLNPHQLSISAQTGLTFRYRLQDGIEYSDRITIDPVNYDLNGVLTPLLNNNKWSVQHINLFQSGLTRIQYGQHQYNSLEEAEQKIKTESFTTETNIADNAIFRCYLIVKKNATDLSNTAQAKFIPVDKWGNVLSGGVAVTYDSIITALGFTPENVANKAVDFTIINDILYPSVKAVDDKITEVEDNLVGYINSGLSTKQDVLTAENVGEFMDTVLPTKLIPSVNDTLLARDSITNEAVEVTLSSLLPNSDVEQQLQRYWYSLMANTLNTTLMQVNNTNVFTVVGTASIVPRASTLYYNSIAMNNYLSATANGSNCGIKNNNQGDGSYLEGFDSSFVFINNDTNINCETTVGYYGLLSAIPNIPKSGYTTDFVGVGNDVGDTNLSFYCKRNTETPSYTKVDCGSAFPAHSTTDAYLLRMQMSRGYNGSGRTLKMTITNIITGAVFSHTFTDTQIPAHSRNITMVVNRSNRNTGVATNIRFSKWHQTKYIY